MKTFYAPDEDDVQNFRLRVFVACVFAFACCLLLATRLYILQVVRHDHFYSKSEGNRTALLPLVPHRGDIIDRNGVMLARNFIAYTLEIDGKQSKKKQNETIDALASIIAIESRDRQRFDTFLVENRRHRSAPIRTRLSDEEVARFIGQRYRFPGVEVQARLFRDYPHGKLASHLIGYISSISENDVERIEEEGETANYRGSKNIGKAGVEAVYEADLHGVTGAEQIEKTAGGYAVRSLSNKPSVSGNSIELSIDIELQKVAEAAFGERRGALVAIEPASGEVLALASMPTFDPNLFVDGISGMDWRMLRDSPDKPLLNRAINSAYPPGSTFKPFMALAGLAAGKRTVERLYPDPGGFWFGNHFFKDDKKGGHGMVNLHKSIVVSCNTYYYVLANDLGIDTIAASMAWFGLGARTGVDLPNESVGILPSPEWKRKAFKTREQQKWYAGETISVGIGQGYNAYTPIQMANALAAVANGGKLMRPRVVRAIIDDKGQRYVQSPELVREIPIKPEHFAAVRKAMEDVTRFGTGARAFAGAPYRAGGKTGTAQVLALKSGQRYGETCKTNPRLCDHSWFIAYAPAEEPKIALAVFVENGGWGAAAAAPIARQVIDFFLLDKRARAPAPADIEDEDSAEAERDSAEAGESVRAGERIE
ncbi:MAG: penicillin-binding protein 2 [Azoarcus sp.]|jgi:penicillin-binding protein 2|nr:penicillin-binding protein 2 [Azoarcus sp.]